MAQRSPRRPRPRLLPAVGAGTLALLVLLAPPGQAETPAPTGPSSAAAATPGAPESSPSTASSPTPAAPATSPAPTSPAPTSPGPTSPAPPESAADEPGITLAVGSTGGPVPGQLWEDLGRFTLTGTTSGVADGATVTLQRQVGKAWSSVATAAVRGGTYATSLPVQRAGAVTFRATVPAPESADLVSASVPVVVQDARVVLARPAATLDSLKSLRVTGSVVPARAGVAVHLDVRAGSHWKQVGAATTTAAGTFTTSLGYGRGALAAYTLRATYHAANTDRWEASASQGFRRVAVLDPQVAATTGADVAKTYRKGCPVGPSKLRTVHLNFYGRDRRVHRGVIIIRADLADEIIRGFGTALARRYPVAKMNNPNVYGGNDPRQMAANNTSGFNCRKVVGNPYAQSPHSYGIALDVNTVQNPYRDARGKWWPANGKPYIDRSPLRWGMLGTSSPLTRSLRGDHFFWGGLWNPGRDYQHFEYRR